MGASEPSSAAGSFVAQTLRNYIMMKNSIAGSSTIVLSLRKPRYLSLATDEVYRCVLVGEYLGGVEFLRIVGIVGLSRRDNTDGVFIVSVLVVQFAEHVLNVRHRGLFRRV